MVFQPLFSRLAAQRTLSGGAHTDFVFPAKDGGAWSPSTYGNWINRVFNPAVKRAGLRPFTPFDLRHGYALLIYRAGGNLKDVSEAVDISPEQAKVMYSRFLSGRRVELPIDPVFEIKQAIKDAEYRNNQVKRIGQ